MILTKYGTNVKPLGTTQLYIYITFLQPVISTWWMRELVR